MKNDRVRLERLDQALRRTTMLSYAEAQAQLPSLVVAELAGEAVETNYAQVLAALDHYPDLAEEYAVLFEEMQAELLDPTPLPQPPQPAAPLLSGKVRRSAAAIVRQLGEQGRQLLVQLLPQPQPSLTTGLLADDDIEYINEWLGDLPVPVHFIASLQPNTDDAWELVVSIIGQSDKPWDVTARLGDEQLPLISNDDEQDTRRFGPLVEYPTQPFTVVCQPIRASDLLDQS